MDTTPIDYKRWYDAVNRRVSTRSYGDPPEQSQLDRLSLLANALGGEGVRIVMCEASGKLFSGLFARNLKSAPHAAMILAKKDAPLAKAGYKGEAFTLEATAMGLATCWLAGTFNQREAKRLSGLEPDEKLIGMIALGKPLLPLRDVPETDRKRKGLDKLVHPPKGQSLADLEPWQNTALKCARIAPSAMNLQPWRFACAPGVICMAASGMFNANAEVDLGIAMLHIDLGAAVCGIRGTWIQEKTVWVFSTAAAHA